MNLREKMVLGSIALAIIGFFYIRFLGNRPTFVVLDIGGTMVKAEKADTIGKQQRGLSGRQSLGPSEGMVFLMATSDQHEFVMRDMRFPLDIIWIDGNTVVDISQDVPNPRGHEKPMTISPRVPANLVLEVNAGWTRLHQINVGDEVKEIK